MSLKIRKETTLLGSILVVRFVVLSSSPSLLVTYVPLQKQNNNGKGFYTQSERVSLFYAMDKNVKEKKVVCGMYEKGELVLSNL